MDDRKRKIARRDRNLGWSDKRYAGISWRYPSDCEHDEGRYHIYANFAEAATAQRSENDDLDYHQYSRCCQNQTGFHRSGKDRDCNHNLGGQRYLLGVLAD